MSEILEHLDAGIHINHDSLTELSEKVTRDTYSTRTKQLSWGDHALIEEALRLLLELWNTSGATELYAAFEMAGDAVEDQNHAREAQE